MNKKLIAVLGVVAFVLGLVVLGCAQDRLRTLTILHTNDTHSALLPFGPNREFGGIARMSALIKRLRARNRNVLAINAGDVFVGAFEFNKYLGYPELKIMDGLYDAMELGNHEFDLGLDVLGGVLAGVLGDLGPVELPVLCANVSFPADSFLESRVVPYIIKQVDGIKVGIFGLVNTDQQNYSGDVYAMLSDPIAAAVAQVTELRGAGCEVVICVSHLGTAWDVQGLSQVPGIDIIVGGHSHDIFVQPKIKGGKIIVQAGDFGRYLGELKVTVGRGHVRLASYTLHPVNLWTRVDLSLLPRLNTLRDGIIADPRFGDVFSEPVALAKREIRETWDLTGPHPKYRDTALGNLVADAMKSGVLKAGLPADIALEVMGYTASKIYRGKVVGNDILRAVPYGYDPASGLGFKIVVVPLPGQMLLGLLEYSVSMIEVTQDLCLEPSGLAFAYDSSKPAAPFGSLSRIDPMSVRVNGDFVNPEAVYMVAMNEQVFKSIEALLPPGMLTSIETGLLEYNLVRDFMQDLGRVRYASEGRIIDTASK